MIRILKTSNWSSNPLLHLHVSPPQSQKHLDPTKFCLHPFTCPIITLRHYCTLLFTENTDKAFQCSFSKLNHSFFFFLFWHKEISQMDPKINQKTIIFISHHWSRGSHKTQTDSQTQRCHRLEEINKVHIHLTVKTCSPTGKDGQERAVFSAPRSGGQQILGSRNRMGRDKHHS